MVHYKLSYFNLRGRAEIARLILHCAQIPFEDFRFERAEWPQYKNETPFQQVPILEVDGQMLCQSMTISRFLARRHGLAGKTEWEQSQAEMYADCIYDLMAAIKPTIRESDPEKQKEMLLKLCAEIINPHLERIEQHFVKNGNGFLVGDELTWADLAYYCLFAPLVERFGDFVIRSSPHLKKLIEHVESIPHMQKYLESRPKTMQ